MSKQDELPVFDRSWPDTGGVSRIGGGDIGGKARGLLLLRDLIASLDASIFAPIDVVVPTFTVIGTDVFDAFLERNQLRDLAAADVSDEEIAHAFQQAALPSEVVGDLRALTERVKWPLAVRSSSRLEDALLRPFAGVYETKMTPNNQPDANTRFQKLVEAIKLVYASTFSRAAKDYLYTVSDHSGDEGMAVVIQDIVGARHGERFYPNLSGVARSFNFYPLGGVPREDGIVDLALGLGKIIVDEGTAYPYVPSRPRRPPPFSTTRDFLQNSQNEFWAVNMGKPAAFDPTREAEYLVRGKLADAEYDGTLTHLVSTYDADSERLTPGMGRPGPRGLTFAPLLQLGVFPLNAAISAVMAGSRRRLGRDVELEFAMTFPGSRQAANPRLGFVQARPMVTPEEIVELAPEELSAPNLLLSSDRVLGNGTELGMSDVVYTKPTAFDLAKTRDIATQLTRLNSELRSAGRPYLLIGFGRWGSSDPWLGIPVQWGQVSGARAVVETTLSGRVIEASQGTHFFHNITSFGVSYFHVDPSRGSGPHWDWLDSHVAVGETDYLRHIRLSAPLTVKVDGRTGLGAIWFPSGGNDDAVA